jgi:hypothetical protein
MVLQQRLKTERALAIGPTVHFHLDQTKVDA